MQHDRIYNSHLMNPDFKCHSVVVVFVVFVVASLRVDDKYNLYLYNACIFPTASQYPYLFDA